MCLPASQQASAWAIPAAGLPVQSSHDLGGRVRNGRHDIVGHARGRTRPGRLVQRGGGVALRLPSDPRERAACAVGGEIGHREDVDAGRAPRLGKVHGAELAGTHEDHAHGALFRGPGEQ
jgi:hypothetical protein